MTAQTKLILLLTFVPILAIAQPQNGIEIGANTTFVEDTKYFNYQPRLGFDIGYQQAFILSPKVALTTGLMFNQYSLSVSDGEGIMAIGTRNAKSSFLSIPSAFNYVINKWCIYGGYQYAYNVGGGLPVNKHNHSLIAGVGYSTKIIDLSLRYMHTLNQQTLGMGLYNFDGNNRPDKGIRLQSIQLSGTIPLGKRKK